MGVSNRHYLVNDLEATCWEQADPLKGENEIIEIGLVILSPQKQELWRGGWFVRPQRNPILSSFCTKLTTITQTEVDSAEGFSNVMTKLDVQVRNVRVQRLLTLSLYHGATMTAASLNATAPCTDTAIRLESI